MSKLQLYISKSFKGYKVLFNVNPSEDITAHIRELRDNLAKVTYDATEKNIFYLLSTIESGTFVTILRTIPSEPVDHLAAWIFIPRDTVIELEELKQVVTTTVRKVSGERVSAQDTADLRELFGKDYPIDPEAPALIESNVRAEMAFRRYNGDTGKSLDTFFGDGLYQLYYSDYSGIMLIDDDLGIKVDGPDLTDAPIGKQSVILPPEKTEQGFVAYLYGHALEGPFRGSLEANLPLTWRRSGFEDVEDAQVITSDPFTPAIVETTGSKKGISRSTFRITGQNSNLPLENSHIIVNGIEITDEPCLFTQGELVQASVVINREGYYPYTAHLDLASTTCALVILKERMKIYKFEIPTKSSDLGSPVEFTLLSKKPLSGSPIEGYSLLDNIQDGETRINRLGYSGGSGSWTQRVVFLLIGLGLGLIASVGLSKCSSGSSKTDDADTTGTTEQMAEIPETPVEVPDNKPEQTTKPAPAPVPATIGKEAISYLDNNDTWNKDKMEAVPGLAGLYDDLNNYRTDRILNVWAPALKDSKRFTSLAGHVRDGRNKAKAKALQGTTYNKDNQKNIKVQFYLYKVNP